MPQLDQITISFVSQVVPLLIVLALIYLLARTMLPKVQATMDARARRVAGDLEAADKAHERADEIEEDYRAQINEARGEANTVTVEAKAKAASDAEARVAASDERLDAELAAAEAALAKQRDAALAEIEIVAVDAARDIVSRISGLSVAETEARNAVKEAMANG
ncbi:MAG: ATPase [Parasphingopyxis sp.]|nr:ATPase [Sphingomonadales bacterium]